ncbi:MAG: hypothetical protein JWQ04_890 [Pedosphaera sp.]|nr:hypothetical protein [Pedosphaera sp.]
MKLPARSFSKAAAYKSRRWLWEYGPNGPPQSGPSCHSKPNQRRSSNIAVTNSGLQRTASRSSLRKSRMPFRSRARCCATQNVRAWPRCKKPVGDGAMRPRYCASAVLAGETTSKIYHGRSETKVPCHPLELSILPSHGLFIREFLAAFRAAASVKKFPEDDPRAIGPTRAGESSGVFAPWRNSTRCRANGARLDIPSTNLPEFVD